MALFVHPKYTIEVIGNISKFHCNHCRKFIAYSKKEICTHYNTCCTRKIKKFK